MNYEPTDERWVAPEQRTDANVRHELHGHGNAASRLNEGLGHPGDEEELVCVLVDLLRDQDSR